MDARLAREPLADHRVVGGREHDVSRERAHVETRPADDERAPPARVRAVDGRQRVGDETRRGIPLARIEESDEMMRDAGAVGIARSGRTDRHPAVDLPRVGANDLRAEPLRQLER